MNTLMNTLKMLAVMATNYSVRNGGYDRACLEALSNAFWAVREQYKDSITNENAVSALYRVIDDQLNEENHSDYYEQ